MKREIRDEELSEVTGGNAFETLWNTLTGRNECPVCGKRCTEEVKVDGVRQYYRCRECNHTFE